MLFTLVASVVTLTLGMSIGFFFARVASRPLARLSQNIERLSREQEQVRALAQAQADELLLEQQKMRALLASLPVTVVEYNGLGECLAIYPTHSSTIDQFPIAPEQQIGRSVFEIFDKKTATNYQSTITQALKKRRTIELAYALTLNQQKRNFLAFVTPQGSNRVLWVSREVTVNRNTELVLGEVLRTMQEAVIMFNKKQEIIFFNYSAEKLFGYKEDEVRGQSPEMLMPERYRALHRFQMAQFGEQNQQKSRMMGRGRKPIPALRKDGMEIQLFASIAKVGYGAGQIFIVFMNPVRTPSSEITQMTYHS